MRDADLAAVVMPAPQSLSLNVSSSCNLSCGYCYADRGAFAGGQTQTMTFEVASAAVARLFAGATLPDRSRSAFSAVKSLRNRSLIQAVVTSPIALAQQRRPRPALFDHDQRHAVHGRRPRPVRNHRFGGDRHVDGDAVAHDAQRPFRNGAGSFAHWPSAFSRCWP